MSPEDTNYIKFRTGTERVREAFGPNCHGVSGAGKPKREGGSRNVSDLLSSFSTPK